MNRLVLAALFSVSFMSSSASAVEDWKGTSPKNEFTLGAMAGLGLVDATAGFQVLGTGAKRILDRGFVPDINDQLFIEAALGPLFISSNTVSTTAFVYSAHLRWDFNYNEDWTLYALGGFGGIQTSSAYSPGGAMRIYPRFGIGALWNFADIMSVRMELSQQFIGVGLQLAI